MISERSIHWKSAVGLVVCAVLVSGCDSRPAQQGMPGEARLRLLGTLYGQYLAQHGGQAPANEEQFKEFLKVKQIKIKDQEDRGIEALFLSPRDGLSLVVRYGKLTGPLSSNGYHWIAHEQTGIGGRIKVISARGEVDEVDQQELHNLFSSKS